MYEIWVQDKSGAMFYAETSNSLVSVTPWMKLEYKGHCKGENGQNKRSGESENQDNSLECL